MNRAQTVLLAATLLLSLIACSQLRPTPQEEDMENTYGISDATQLNYYDGNLSIGVGNFWREEYVDEQGVTRSGPTAGLWITVRDDPSQSGHVRVHVGQELTVGRYSIRVVEIGHEDGTAFVRLAITVAGTPTP